MGYEINYEKNIEMNLKSNSVIQECMNSLDRAEEILNRIKETDSVKCKAKKSLNAYIGDVIISKMISTAKEAIQWLMLEQACYVYEMYDHDDCETSIIEEECLDGIISRLTEHFGITEENLAGCKAAADAVSDIMTLYPKAPDDMENAYAGLKEKAEKTRDTYREYLTKFEARAGNLEQYISECRDMVSQCANADINMEEYVPGCGDALWAHETDSARVRFVTNVGYTEEEIEKVSEKSEEIITAYIRRKEGEAKILRLGGVIIGGLSFICPFALGYSMPAIVASCTMSSICVVYNVDEVYQGVQLLKASETRDTDAEIDRLVDFHNEVLNKGYAILGELSTAYCGTLVGGTFIGKISGGKTLSFKSAVIETGEDVMTDQIAGCIDETLGGANPLKRMIINLVIGGGTNAAKNKISAGKVTNNLDVIDATDAKNVVKNVDVTDAKNVIKDIDAADVKNAVRDVDAIDIKTATNVKEPVVGLQQGHIRSEIKADTPKVLDVVNGDTVSGRSIESDRKTVRNGAIRASQYSSEWGDASLKEAIDKFAPNVEPVVTSKGKVIYSNPETGISIVYDKNGNYFRIEDTTRPRGRNYLDIDGNDMNNEVVNGKIRGRNKTDYQKATHFNNTDKDKR